MRGSGAAPLSRAWGGSPNVSHERQRKSPVSEQTAKRSTIETGRLRKAHSDPQTRSPVLHPHIPGSARHPATRSFFYIQSNPPPAKRRVEAFADSRQAAPSWQSAAATCTARGANEVGFRYRSKCARRACASDVFVSHRGKGAQQACNDPFTGSACSARGR